MTQDEEKYFDNIRSFVNDRNLPSFKEPDGFDKWWTGETMDKKHPTLCKVAKAPVTIFHRAQVESIFSVISGTFTE